MQFGIVADHQVASGRPRAAVLRRSASCARRCRRSGSRGRAGRRPPRRGRRRAGSRTSSRRCRTGSSARRASSTRWRRRSSRHRAGFVDAFLQHLPVLRFLVEHQLVGVLAAYRAGRAGSRCRAGGTCLPCRRCAIRRARSARRACRWSCPCTSMLQDAHEGHRGRDFAPLAVPSGSARRRERRHRQRLGLAPA